MKKRRNGFTAFFMDNDCFAAKLLSVMAGVFLLIIGLKPHAGIGFYLTFFAPAGVFIFMGLLGINLIQNMVDGREPVRETDFSGRTKYLLVLYRWPVETSYVNHYGKEVKIILGDLRETVFSEEELESLKKKPGVKILSVSPAFPIPLVKVAGD